MFVSFSDLSFCTSKISLDLLSAPLPAGLTFHQPIPHQEYIKCNRRISVYLLLVFHIHRVSHSSLSNSHFSLSFYTHTHTLSIIFLSSSSYFPPSAVTTYIQILRILSSTTLRRRRSCTESECCSRNLTVGATERRNYTKARTRASSAVPSTTPAAEEYLQQYLSMNRIYYLESTLFYLHHIQSSSSLSSSCLSRSLIS